MTLSRTSEPSRSEPVSGMRLRIAPRRTSTSAPDLRALSQPPPPRVPPPPRLPSELDTLDGVPRRLVLLPPPPRAPRAEIAPPPRSLAVWKEPCPILVLQVPYDGARRRRRVMATFVTLLLAFAVSLATSVALSYA